MTAPSQSQSPATRGPAAPVVAIIGGGFAGTLTAAHLLRRAVGPLRVVLIESSARVGPGLAYSTEEPLHLLNVPAGKMSAFADDPDHFLRWAVGQDKSVDSWSFLPRAMYGRYIETILNDAVAAAPRGVGFEICRDIATGVAPHRFGDDFVVSLKRGAPIRAGAVVLAVGNAPPRRLRGPQGEAESGERIIENPWDSAALAAIDPADPVLIVGTGLTMLDVVTSLHRRGHQGQVTALSRHGLLPTSHRGEPRLTRYTLPVGFAERAWTARGLLRAVRAEALRAESLGGDWRDAIDALRPHTASIWRSLPERERRTFLKHGRWVWDAHRHRCAPDIASAISILCERGWLEVVAGRIESIRSLKRGVRVTWRPRRERGNRVANVGWVINCTGPETDVTKSGSPLVQRLLSSGLVKQDPLRLGVETADNGAAIGANGHASERIFVVGAWRRATLWESTAVPELRAQAAAVAERLLNAGVGDRANERPAAAG